MPFKWKCLEEPGQSAIVTQRKEPDDVQFLSGIFEGKTTGTPIVLLFQIPIRNQMITLIRQLQTQPC
jgi:chorismate synthase